MFNTQSSTFWIYFETSYHKVFLIWSISFLRGSLARRFYYPCCLKNPTVGDSRNKWNSKACVLSGVWLFMTPWTVALQAPLSMRFPSKNTGEGCHFRLQSHLGIELVSPALAGRFFTTVPPGKSSLRMLYIWENKL